MKEKDETFKNRKAMFLWNKGRKKENLQNKNGRNLAM